MLINRVTYKESGRAGDAEMQDLNDSSTELQTAEEMYQIMAKNNAFDGDGDKALTASDLVILYKNIEIDTKLAPTANQQTRCSNQYVETVICNDDRGSEGSDSSEDISNEGFSNVFAINEEKINLMNNFGDKLSHKFGVMQMQSSELTTEYDKHFLFNDPMLKEQLKCFRKTSGPKHSDSTVLPASLLDYICCKRIGDNYNLYMDNIIKHVQNTIEQLKRISNGDYLTEKAKEKWREVYGADLAPEKTSLIKNTVLSNSVSKPLRVKDDCINHKIAWDDIVHSEMDIRSLSKILEKKVIVEVPKIICGTYRLFTKCCQDNLIITCKKNKEEKEDAQVDVVLKLQRSKLGNVISNIDSIMILKSLPTIATETDTHSNELLALEYKKINVGDKKVEQENDAIGLDETMEEISTNDTANYSLAALGDAETDKHSEDDFDFLPQSECQEGNECGFSRAEADFNTTTNDNLHSVIYRLSMQTPVIEESEDSMNKKKSPLRARIKSPYENKSFVIEEQKRQKLLEIREKREIKKNVMSEKCRITKPRYGKGAIMIQASNSVTKLSITNKHFYNSIYGQSLNMSRKHSRQYLKDQTRDSIPEIVLVDDEDIHYKDSPLSPSLVYPEKNDQKYINRSYYLDDADTEVMHLQRKENESLDLRKDASPTINNNGANLNFLEQFIAPSTTDLSLTDTSSNLQQIVLCDDSFVDTEKEIIQKNALTLTRSTQVTVPTNSSKIEVLTQDENCKTTTSVECRRSIDKIYNLMKQIGKTDSSEVLHSQVKTENNIDKVAEHIQLTCGRGSSTVQASDSGTSIKHQFTSSNPSCCSFAKEKSVLKVSKESKKKIEKPKSVIPKVTINSKLPSNKSNNKEFTKISTSKIQDNPLKALSQLIHEFDNVHKLTIKTERESKKNKKAENLTTQDKMSTRQNFVKRIPKQDQYLRDFEATSSKNTVKERKGTGYDSFKIIPRKLQAKENSLYTTNRKKITDIIDEVKELKGEAVRGPSRKLARLNSLAQPKKTYLQPYQEDSQNRFGKRIMDRLPKPSPILGPERNIGFTRSKQKKISDELPSPPKQPHSAGSPSEKSARTKLMANNSPKHDGFGKRSLGPTVKPPYIYGNVNKTAEQLKGKMVAVETYVKSHYGRESRPLELCNSYAHKSRVPLIPNDLDDVASLISSPSAKEESAALGKKLHYMVDSMISSTIPVLSAVAEGIETASKIGDDISVEEEIILSGSEYPVDIFEDKNIVTAVSIISQDHKEDKVVNGTNLNKTIGETDHHSCSPSELNKPENDKYDSVLNGTFEKLPGTKNFTLNITPKQSVENVLILKSGDTRSLLLKSKLSQNTGLKTKPLMELNILPALSNNRFTDFSFTNFPMQIATVGYALPHITKRDSSTKIRLLENEFSKSKDIKSITSSENITSRTLSNSSLQCFKCTLKPPIERESPLCLCTEEHKNGVIENNFVGDIKIESTKRKTKHNTVETKSIDEDIVAVDIKKSNISNSTSLDILVELLNEIRNITSYQSHIPKQEISCDIGLENKEFEVILNNVAVKESSIDHSIDNAMSLSSIDNLQITEAHASNFCYLSSNVEDNKKDKKISDKNLTTYTTFHEPSSVDREVNAKLWQTNYLHSNNEAPSRYFQVSVSTNVTDSLIKLINKSSSSCTYSVTECKSFASLANEIKEFPTDITEKFIKSASPPPILKIKYINENEKYTDIKPEPNKQSLVEFNPLMKMKRDILVTVYSILVFTVFAALSFPEIMYRV